MHRFPGWELGTGNKPIQGSQISTLSQQQMKNAGKWCCLIFSIANKMTHLYIQCCVVALDSQGVNKIKNVLFITHHTQNTLQ